jgi:hypothetical protein
MTDMASIATDTVIEPTIEDQPSPDAGGHRHAEEVRGPDADTLPVLPDGDADGIVVDAHQLDVELPDEPLAKREPAPSGHVERRDLAGRPDHWPSTRDADAIQISGQAVRPSERGGATGDQRFVQRLGIGPAGGWDPGAAEDSGISIHDRGSELGAADVDGEDEGHAEPI